MDVVTAEQAKIAEDAGAVAVMALERVPADIRAQGGVSRMSDPDMIDGIIDGRLDPGDGQGPHRPLRRGPGAAVPRRRLHRRVRGADPGRLREPHRQVAVHRALRLRRDQPRRGAAPDHRGRGDDPLQGRGRHRRRLQRHHAHAHRSAARSAGCTACARTSSTSRPRSCRRRTSWSREVAARRQAAGRAVHRRRHRHPGRRRDDDAARRRGRLRRLRHLQVRQPGRSAPRRSSRRRRSTTTPTSSPRSPAASARPWSASTSTRSRSRTGSPSAAGDRTP